MLDLKFYDLTASSKQWEEIYKIARDDVSHVLWENYQHIDLSTYECMILTELDSIPASFQGIYNNGRWPANVSRFCNRAYINPYFRNQGLGLEITCQNIKYTLDNYQKWGKDVLFISRGVQYDNVDISWRKFKKFCEYLIKNTGYNLVYDNRLYQCCPKSCKDCYQFCVWYDPLSVKNNLSIHSVSQDEWNNLVDL